MTNFNQLHAWALGHNVALGSLSNIANEVGARNRRETGGKLYPVGIRSTMIDLFPVRELALSGKERGDGIEGVALEMTLARLGVKYILDTYLSSGTVVSAAMTLYTRRSELDTYTRGNCYLTLPKPGQDIEYLRQGVFRVTWRFTDFTVI